MNTWHSYNNGKSLILYAEKTKKAITLYLTDEQAAEITRIQRTPPCVSVTSRAVEVEALREDKDFLPWLSAHLDE